jgi:hypothetical protein
MNPRGLRGEVSMRFFERVSGFLQAVLLTVLVAVFGLALGCESGPRVDSATIKAWGCTAARGAVGFFCGVEPGQVSMFDRLRGDVDPGGDDDDGDGAGGGEVMP